MIVFSVLTVLTNRRPSCRACFANSDKSQLFKQTKELVLSYEGDSKEHTLLVTSSEPDIITGSASRIRKKCELMTYPSQPSCLI